MLPALDLINLIRRIVCDSDKGKCATRWWANAYQLPTASSAFGTYMTSHHFGCRIALLSAQRSRSDHFPNLRWMQLTRFGTVSNFVIIVIAWADVWTSCKMNKFVETDHFAHLIVFHHRARWHISMTDNDYFPISLCCRWCNCHVCDNTKLGSVVIPDAN